MLIKEFFESGISYKVHEDDMSNFLKECEGKGLKWWFKLRSANKSPNATFFNPFRFYERYEYRLCLLPIMEIDDAEYVYIKCVDGLLYWSFHYDWQFQPFKTWGKDKQ